MTLRDMDDEDDDDNGGFGSAGALSSPSSSRARMLAQQRDIQLKRRQSAQSSGKFRTFFFSKFTYIHHIQIRFKLPQFI